MKATVIGKDGKAKQSSQDLLTQVKGTHEVFFGEFYKFYKEGRITRAYLTFGKVFTSSL